MNQLSQIEALLFVVGEEGIELEEIAFTLERPTADVYQSLTELKAKYAEDPTSALTILEVGNRFVLTTKKVYAPLLKEFARSPLANRLSQAALETLSIIAYKQPITRGEIDELRGVQSSGAVQTLVSRQLIEEKGRVEGPGRAILYGTTTYFMDYFGLKDLTELPDVQQMETDLADDEETLDLFYDRFKEKDEN
ncbi:SMC-Scp complex subunit ScpB [Enterococcus sp. 669A]|uniref:Segregation and condensation protein B n=1 Tax=Candidatus Enterococcus moelleringii TaxID=2815325 RepID=A0ABS3LEF0_9ENTE|nr:SMC-Scp complex subunit ScpB [Enterococcus sp. 669A]MBO1306754.1 SMC-Scp complex subunit ScpB [Enterococcus sp. 669A]